MRSHSSVRYPSRRLVRVLLLVLFAAVSPRLAVAMPIAIQHPVVNFGVGSDADFGLFTFDDFTVGAAATARSVTWTGIYAPPGAPSLVDAFTINFFTHSAGPGVLLQSFAPGNAVHRTATGIMVNLSGNDYELFDFAADLGPGLALAAGGHYWLSIYNDTTGDPHTWNWVGDGTTGTRVLSGASQNGAMFGATGSLYFAVDDANLAAVPEPATLALLGLGLGARTVVSRRRAKQSS